MKKTKMITTLGALAVVLLLGAFVLPTQAQAAKEGYYTYTVSNGEATITKCDTSISGDIVIPSTLGGYPVTALGAYPFDTCANLTGVTIPDSVRRVGNFAFYDCDSLTSVTIGAGVVSFGERAFYSCDKLAGIWVDENNANYSSDSHGVLFNKAKTDLLAVPCGISGDYTIPDTVTNIDGLSFRRCYSLTGVTIPDSVERVGDSAFQDCTGLTFAIIGDGVTTIENWAFEGCTSLTSVTLGSSITSIGYYAFMGTKLTSVTIPASVTEIGDLAFSGCLGMTGIWVDKNNANYASDSQGVLFDKDKTVLKQAPGGISDSYTVPSSVKLIGAGAFRKCSGLTGVVIPSSVTKIDQEAFYECTGLTDVYYTGTENQWKAMDIRSFNDPLTTATIHYEYVLVEDTGDLDGDGTVNNKDVEYLLWYTLFPGSYPVTGNADFDGNGTVNNKDVEYLLWHTLFPDSYPLTK